MPNSIRVDWTQDHEFLRLVRNRTARRTRHYRGIDDPLEPLSVVWAGLDCQFMDGQILEGNEIGRMLKILDRNVSSYFRSRGSRPIEQPNPSCFDHNDVESVKSTLNAPHQEAIQQEHLRLIDAKLSEMLPKRAEAVRSYFGFPDAPDWAEYVRLSGTSRQNVTKHLKRGLEELKPLIASFFPDAIRDGCINPRP